jgi:peptidoglycan hydrolase-like protein with peptidoglycan-binding domain
MVGRTPFAPGSKLSRGLHRALRRLLPLVAAVALVAASAPQVAALSASYPQASAGNRGANVRALQYLLRDHGAIIGVTGIFDAPTIAAVKAFQAASGLTADGEVGTTTWSVLVVRLEPGSSGDAVVGLQGLLNEKRRTKLALTGEYDAAVAAAVTAFQAHARIAVTGIADAATWRLLLAHLELPVFGPTLCDYSVGNGPANWGTAAAIGQLEAAAGRLARAGFSRPALGDIGFEHGGPIPGHVTHQQGLDVDLRLMRTDDRQCARGTNWRSSTYDRAATRVLVKAIRATAPGHVKVIYFNDPVLVREGLTRWHTGHDDHLHVRYCERVHPLAAYHC